MSSNYDRTYIALVTRNMHIPKDNTRLDQLTTRIYEFLEYCDALVENRTAYTLPKILDNWSKERRLMNDMSREDIIRTRVDIIEFIRETHKYIDNVMDEDDAESLIRNYMLEYNNRIFDVISGRDPESTEPRNLDILDEPYLKLLVMMRWRQDLIMAKSLHLFTTKVPLPPPEFTDLIMDTGIVIDDLVRNLDSLGINKEMREDLRAILGE